LIRKKGFVFLRNFIQASVPNNFRILQKFTDNTDITYVIIPAKRVLKFSILDMRGKFPDNLSGDSKKIQNITKKNYHNNYKRLLCSFLEEHSSTVDEKPEKTRLTTSVQSLPHLIIQQGQGQGDSSSTKVKLPLPPKQFRDPPGRKSSLQDCDSRETKIRSSLKSKNDGRRARMQQRHSTALIPNLQDLEIDPGSSVPMRRKAKDLSLDHHSSSSLSRIDSKRASLRASSNNADCFVVDSTGDRMENKPLVTNNRYAYVSIY
jgi:hypothetical protein